MAMQGQSLEKKTELLIIPGEPYLFNVQIILYFKDQNSLYSKTWRIFRMFKSSVCPFSGKTKSNSEI